MVETGGSRYTGYRQRFGLDRSSSSFRLLLDDLGVGAADDETFRWLDAHPNVNVSLFNPIAARDSRKLGLVADPLRLNRRMHNKSMTADNTVTVVGGRNIGDEYFSLNELFNFADMDVLAIGPVANQVSRSFDAFWNSPATIPVSAFHEEAVGPEQIAEARSKLDALVDGSGGPYYEAMRETPLSRDLQAQDLDLYRGRITALHDLPDKVSANPESEVLLSQLRGLLGQVRSELLIVSPYFVPGKAGTAGLVAAASLHAKVFIIDREKVFFGSMNLDPRSVEINTEIGLLIESPELARDLVSRYGAGLASACYTVVLEPEDPDNPGGRKELVWVESRDGESIRYDKEPQTTFWQRFGVGFIGLFPVDSQL